MNKKTLTGLVLATIAVAGVTAWFLRQRISLRLVTVDENAIETLQLLDDIAVNNFLTRHPLRRTVKRPAATTETQGE